MTDVKLEVEVWVVDPIRHMQTARQLRQATPESGQQVQTGVDFLQNPFEGHPTAWRRRRVIDKENLNLNRRLRTLGPQHHVIGPAQLLHASPLSPLRQWAS